mmetsp:Transcript_10008/g.27397  ORF Transcript_10008/g.27397 Transcript_10008/m.27397 type:complete len:82 (-) Transcript_10008:2215-2460(-)
MSDCVSDILVPTAKLEARQSRKSERKNDNTIQGHSGDDGSDNDETPPSLPIRLPSFTFSVFTSLDMSGNIPVNSFVSAVAS